MMCLTYALLSLSPTGHPHPAPEGAHATWQHAEQRHSALLHHGVSCDLLLPLLGLGGTRNSLEQHGVLGTNRSLSWELGCSCPVWRRSRASSRVLGVHLMFLFFSAWD